MVIDHIGHSLDVMAVQGGDQGIEFIAGTPAAAGVFAQVVIVFHVIPHAGHTAAAFGQGGKPQVGESGFRQLLCMVLQVFQVSTAFQKLQVVPFPSLHHELLCMGVNSHRQQDACHYHFSYHA